MDESWCIEESYWLLVRGMDGWIIMYRRIILAMWMRMDGWIIMYRRIILAIGMDGGIIIYRGIILAMGMKVDRRFSPIRDLPYHTDDTKHRITLEAFAVEVNGVCLFIAERHFDLFNFEWFWNNFFFIYEHGHWRSSGQLALYASRLLRMRHARWSICSPTY